MATGLKPELKEFAPPEPSPWGFYDSGRRLADPILRSEGYAGHATPYALFEEMEDKDPHLFSALQTRKLGVLARRRKVEAAGERARDREAAAWLERTLERTPGWQAALLHLLDALGKGMAVLEVMWGFDAEGRIVPTGLRPRAAERFARSADGQWRLLGGTPGLGDSGVPDGGSALPPRKFVFCLFGANDERPYGKGLCEKAYWLWWFKKHNLKFWLLYNEKFGAPTVVARHKPGLSEPERARLLEVIEAIQNDAGVTLPEGITLELLEAKRSGPADTYYRLAQWCNDEISRAVLGQTLTSSAGETGSLALGEIHEGVRQDYLRADAWMLMDAINAQLARWLVDFNWGEDFPAPRWTIDTAEELDLESEARVDSQLLQMGVTLPESYFYGKYGRPAPVGKERRLEYDDSNVYQYHLQYGILTVNEVRAKLGLTPVAWGDVPTSSAAMSINPSTPGRAAGEANNSKKSGSSEEWTPGGASASSAEDSATNKLDVEAERLKRTEK